MNNMKKKRYHSPALRILELNDTVQCLLAGSQEPGTGNSKNPGHCAARPYAGGDWDEEDY